MTRSLRYFFSTHIPHFDRVLLVESGSRHIFDNLLPGVREQYGDRFQADLVTCFTGQPEHLPPGAQVWRVWQHTDPASRKTLLAELKARRYNVVAIICSGEPIMTKWKWWLALQIPAKVCVLNENGDYYWFDYSNWRTMLHFIVFRAGLSGPSAFTTVTRLLLFPFALVYLLLWAGWAHLRRVRA
ncbi:MAG: hypothetical protein JNK87_14595 [Bryobacterales bacterium]|nr:hypothetical protein [Bryobacterales bacterium]